MEIGVYGQQNITHWFEVYPKHGEDRPLKIVGNHLRDDLASYPKTPQSATTKITQSL
jgi:hypothetical protein